MADESVAIKMAELNKLLASGKYGRVIPKLGHFLKKKGITDKGKLSGEGWMLALCGMVPCEYKTLDDLLQAIKDS